MALLPFRERLLPATVAGGRALRALCVDPPKSVRERAVPMIFLHGAMFGPWSFSPLMQFFARRGFSCAAPELRGHVAPPAAAAAAWGLPPPAPGPAPAAADAGSSVAGGGEDVLLRDFVRDLKPLLRGTAPPLIVAHSSGGFIAQRWVESYAVAGLVLLSSLPPNPGACVRRLLTAACAQEGRGADSVAAFSAAVAAPDGDAAWLAAPHARALSQLVPHALGGTPALAAKWLLGPAEAAADAALLDRLSSSVRLQPLPCQVRAVVATGVVSLRARSRVCLRAWHHILPRARTRLPVTSRLPNPAAVFARELPSPREPRAGLRARARVVRLGRCCRDRG
jgi:alpha-beta hydrolase superfamily lysophospholipase